MSRPADWADSATTSTALISRRASPPAQRSRVRLDAHGGAGLQAVVEGRDGAVDQQLQFLGRERLQHVDPRPRQRRQPS